METPPFEAPERVFTGWLRALPVQIERLELQNFRNYARQTLRLEPGLDVIVGENAQGKSNLIEALYALSSTRSVRTPREQEVIRWGESVARLEATLARALERWTVELAWQFPGPRRALEKRARINHQVVPRFSELFSLVRMVLFAADDLHLVSGPPGGRRRFLDYLISKTDPLYLDALQHYQQVLRQRNEWLRRPRAGLREVLDEQLCRWGAPVSAARAVVVTRLAPLCTAYYEALTGAAVPLTLGFISQVDGAAAMADLLTRRHAEELRRQTTVVGSHRDDVDLRLGGEPLHAFGSRGQLRCAALALRLAQGDLMAQGDDSVIYLLDDCMSELDPTRQAYLWNHLTAREQVIVTGTPDVLAHGPRGPLTVLELQHGVLSPRAPGSPEAT